ncbi:MAG: hypothetical protein ACYCS7_02405 [Acidimicrobiales bacterium]
MEPNEDSTIAKALIEDAIVRHGVQPGQLTLHPDRGTPIGARR